MVSLLSQYIGLLSPLAHVYGLFGLSVMALIDSKSFAISFDKFIFKPPMNLRCLRMLVLDRLLV